MIKKISAVASLVAMSALFSAAHASSLYAKVGAGVSLDASAKVGTTELALDDGHTYSGAVGAKVGKYLRLEAEVGRVSNDTSLGFINAQVHGLYYNGSAYADLFTVGKVTPFVGGGYGYMTGEVRALTLKQALNGGAWHADAGVALQVSDAVTVEASVRRMEADLSTSATGGTKIDYTSTVVGGALRVKL